MDGPFPNLTIRASLAHRHALFLVIFGQGPEGPGPPMQAEGWRTAGTLQKLEEIAR